MHVIFYKEDFDVLAVESIPSNLKVMTLPEFVEECNSKGLRMGAQFWDVCLSNTKGTLDVIISKQEIPDENPQRCSKP